MEEKPRLYLFSTGRSLQRFYQSSGEGFLPYAMTWEEFVSSLWLFPHQKNLPASLRPLFLSLAALEIRVDKLGFEANFLSFLEQSPFFLSFFDELASVGVDIETIGLSDTYDEYGDHLGVLRELRARYLSLLASQGYGEARWGEGAEFYEGLVRGYSEIRFFVEGFLSAGEGVILGRIATLTPVILHLEIDRYNVDYYRRLGILGDSLEAGYAYEVEWKTQAILHRQPLLEVGAVEAYAFDSRLDQVALALERVAHWVKEGIAPEKIAVVLPDEGFSDYLRLFDEARNFNYAMGERAEESPLYRSLEALEAEFSAKELASPIEIPCRGIEALEWLMDETKARGLGEEAEAIGEVVEFLAPLRALLAERSLGEMMQILLRQLREQRIDDIGGGKVRVLGILETRGMEFERVVIVDFNEGLIPRPSDKDIFLNSSIRRRCALPTRLDRENLQKHYYLSLLRRTPQSAIALVQSESNEPSRLLLELGIAPQEGKRFYARTLFPAPLEPEPYIEEIVGLIPWESERFSHSRLRTFLECKRRYYYRYVRRYSEREEGSEAASLGSLVHEILHEIYRKRIAPSELAKGFKERLEARGLKGILGFEAERVRRSLGRFFAHEKARLEAGAEVLWLEERVEFAYEGVGFVGVIDRVDRVGEEYWIIDYKLKNSVKADGEKQLERTSDFQFALYALALRERLGAGAKVRAFYYDLWNGALVEEILLDEKITLLGARLALLKENPIAFERAEDSGVCRYCSYGAICGRES